MGHLLGDDHAQFHEAGDAAVLSVGALVDHLFLSGFRDGVAVGASVGEQTVDYLDGPRRMVVAQVVAYEVAVAGEGLARAFVHVKDAAVGVAYGDGAVEAFGPRGEQILDFCGHGG